MYKLNKIIPVNLPTLHLLNISSTNSSITEANNIIEELVKSPPVEIDPPERSITIKKGSPKPTKISKMLEPIALLTAISPRPCFATINEENRSGIEVPIAKTVNAIIDSGM